MPDRKPSVLRGIVTGVAAGLAATLVMDQFQRLSDAAQRAAKKQHKLFEDQSAAQIEGEQARVEQKAAQEEGSTEIVARKIAETAGTPLDKEDKKRAGQAVHYAFGTLMGVVYCVAAEMLPEVKTGAGTAFGTMLFLGADEVVVPAFQLSPPPTSTAPMDHLQHWAAHVVYGGSLELVRGLVRRLL